MGQVGGKNGYTCIRLQEAYLLTLFFILEKWRVKLMVQLSKNLYRSSKNSIISPLFTATVLTSMFGRGLNKVVSEGRTNTWNLSAYVEKPA